MIDSYHHIAFIDGADVYKFRLAEGAEGQHYVEGVEPLRPPNASVVQGTDGKFQMRPDTLTWRLDDWSGGEGQLKFDPENPNRHRVIQADPFIEPGVLRQKRRIIDATFTDTNGDEVAILDVFYTRQASGVLSSFQSQAEIYALGRTWSNGAGGAPSQESILLLEWIDTSTKWQEQARMVAPGGTTRGTKVATVFVPFSSGTRFFFITEEDNNLYELTESGGWSFDGVWTTGSFHELGLMILGDFAYALTTGGESIQETSATTASSSVDTVFSAPAWIDPVAFVAGDNRGYLIGILGDRTLIYELTPTTPVGPASGSQIASLPITAVSAWYAHGKLFIVDRERDTYYLTPGSDYGVVAVEPDNLGGAGTIRPYHPLNTGEAISYYAIGTGDVVALDLINGASARVAEIGAGADINRLTTITFSSDVVMAGEITSFDDPYTVYIDTFFAYAGISLAISPWHDFGVVEDKVLTSVRVNIDKPAADMTVSVFALVDGEEGSGTSVGTISGVQSGSVELVPSTTITFSTLSLRIIFNNNVGDTETVRIYHVEARAVVQANQDTWRLLLDLANDESGPGLSGKQKRNNLIALKGKALTFRNGYLSGAAGDYEDFDVIIDSVQILADRAGEAVAAVTLRELT